MLPEVKTAAVAIDAMEERHWDGARAIYQAGIDTGDATFASSPVVSWNAWQRDHFNEVQCGGDGGQTRHRLGKPRAGLGPLRVFGYVRGCRAVYWVC